MASHSQARILTFKADGAITAYTAVKNGTDAQHVAAAAATSDSMKGISQDTALVAGDPVEVAIPGGGGKALAGGTITDGDLLTWGASGLVTASDGNRVVAMAMDGAVVGDIFPVEVIAGIRG